MIAPRPRRMSVEALPEQWHPIVKFIYATRVNDAREVDKHSKFLLPADELTDIDLASRRLAAAITNNERILIYGDYDVDGATSTALCVRVLKRLGANIDWFIPHREYHGYGLSEAGLNALSSKPSLIVTVDNGIRAHAAVSYAKQQGIEVIITDHHLPDDGLPNALAVVNPNRVDCAFASKHLAGVGVSFYLLMALRNHLLAQSLWPEDLRLSDYLDLVALGTIADVVALDHNNRILVSLGLQCMRSAKSNSGIRALCAVSNVNPAYLSAQDIGFALAPRLNALGRLGSMADGVAMLLSDDWMTVQEFAEQCERLNRDRKMIENTMVTQASKQVDESQRIICVYQADWHEGVLGIVAARLKTTFARPVLVACDHANGQQIKASLRSVAGVAIDQLLNHIEGLLPVDVMQYGGHAMAAGLTIDKSHFADLVQGLQTAFVQLLGDKLPPSPLYVDGELPADLMQVSWAKYLEQLEPWGAGLPAPLFNNVFECVEWRQLGTQHSRLVLREPYSGQVLQATWFFQQMQQPLNGLIEVAYEMQVNRFYGDERLNLLIRAVRPFNR